MPAYRVLGACNPKMGYQAIGIEPRVGAMLPCNIILREVEGGVEVSAIDPVASMQAIENAGRLWRARCGTFWQRPSMRSDGTHQREEACDAFSGDPSRPASVWDAPELPVAYFSFALHFVWEFVQVSTYTGMAELPHWEAIKLCMSATFGDVGFAR